jgi:hypothetical protein
MLKKSQDRIKPIVRDNEGAVRSFKTVEFGRCSKETYREVKKILADEATRKSKVFTTDIWFDEDGNWSISLSIKNKKK